MGTAAQETAASLRAGSTGLNRTCPAEPSHRSGGILIEQMGILCPTSFAKVLHLHDFRQHRNIHSRLCGLCKVVSLEDFFVLEKSERDSTRVTRYLPGGKRPCASIFAGIFVGLSVFPPSTFVPVPDLLSCAGLLAYFSSARLLRVLSPLPLHLPFPSLFCQVRAASMLRILQQDLSHPYRRRQGFLPLSPLEIQKIGMLGLWLCQRKHVLSANSRRILSATRS